MGPHQLLALLSTVPQADPPSSFARSRKNDGQGHSKSRQCSRPAWMTMRLSQSTVFRNSDAG